MEKLKLGDATTAAASPGNSAEGQQAEHEQGQPQQSEDVDEIFRKMKEMGLIPSAVAMLDGLCKSGLVQEAMKLFGLMREKGAIPEVVIYTAVVEAFCKATKLDDAVRIFRKIQGNGVIPNAFSYWLIIQGLTRAAGWMMRLVSVWRCLRLGTRQMLQLLWAWLMQYARRRGLMRVRSL